MFDHLKNHLQISSPGKMYNPGSCNILNQWLVIAVPGPQFSRGSGSMAPSVRTLTSVPGNFTFTLLQPPTRKATPGSYLGWLLLQPWNLKQQGPTLWPVPLIFPELSHHTGLLTSSWIPGSGYLPPYQAFRSQSRHVSSGTLIDGHIVWARNTFFFFLVSVSHLEWFLNVVVVFSFCSMAWVILA